MSNSVILIVPRSCPSFDGDHIALLVVEVGGEIEGHADGGKHLRGNLTLGQFDGRLRGFRQLLHLRGVFLGVLLLEIGSHTTENARKDEEGDDDNQKSRNGDNPAFGVDPVFVSQQ